MPRTWFNLLPREGELAQMVREHDWEATPLGPPERWPQPLRTLLSLILDSQQPMFTAWGPERIFLYNDAYAPILGARHPAALGAGFYEIWDDIREDVGPILERAYAGQSTHVHNLKLIMHRNGYPEETYFAFSYTPVRDVAGDVAGMFCSCREITEQVLAEQQRVAEAERLRTLFHAAPSFVAILGSPLHVFEFTNAAYLQLIGHRDPVGKTMREAIPELADQGFFELLDQVYATGEPFIGSETSVRLQRTPGAEPEERFVDFIFQPIRDASNAVTGIFIEGNDVTERKRAESALREASELNRRVLDSTSDCITVLTLDGALTYVSPGGVTAMEVDDLSALLGLEWLRVWPEPSRALASAALDEARAGRQGRFQGFCRTLKGSPKWWDVLTLPMLDAEGRPERILAVARDVSAEHEAAKALERANDTLEAEVEARTRDLMEAEEALRQAQKMEAVGQLTGGIAHDFNNLLQGILGSLNLVQKRIAQGRTSDVDRFITGAVTSANRAAALTHRLLAFSRRQPLDPKPVRANALVASMEDLLRRTLGEHIALELVLAGGLWQTLCDPNQLESALLNLAINARDAMPDGGKLTVETCNAHLDSLYAAKSRDVRPGQYVCLCVTDTGAGMDADVIARAFDPFFTTKPIGQGTGLGLSMIYGFARQSEGYAKIYSEVGQGTTVKLYLPRLRGENGETGEEDVPAGLNEAHFAEAGETVLVVEDEPVVRGLIVEVLHDLGYAALEAADGPAGLDLLRSKRRVDLLVTDIGLPGLNGRQLADAAREFRPDMRVLFMTGYAENAAFAGGFLDAGMAMITKPFAMEHLATRIRDMIEEG